MGEEEKKPAAEEVKKTEEDKKEDAPSGGDEKKEEKKTEEAPAVPPPPQDIVLRVYMHCEGCARKVRKSLKGFQGVENVVTDCKSHEVVVKGEKADPLKVLERVQKKSHRQVELLSPIQKPPAEEPKKPEEKEVVKPEKKKEEPKVITVVLKVHMHCEACAQEIKRRIQKMKGVENAEPDLKNSQVTVKGVFEATQLVDYVSKRTGKRAVIVKVEPEKKEEEKPNEEKKTEEGEKDAKKADEGEKKAEGGSGDSASAVTAAAASEEAAAAKEVVAVQEDPKLEMKKNEFYYHYPQQNYQLYPQRYAHEMYNYYPQQNYQLYPQRYAHEMYNSYPTQVFSDENPNACSVM